MGDLPGNDKKYAIENVKALTDSSIKNDTIIFLGSSITYGASAKGVSFVDYIAAETGCNVIKEAVSGTTLVDESEASYISRMLKIDRDVHADIFVCQLSTNDASQNKKLGEIGESTDISDFDIKTVAGAIEYIIAYARATWNSRVIFYTNPRYGSEKYGKMVELMNRIAEKWGVTVIDMWNDAEFNNISEDEKKLYMADDIHPTQAGYYEWWTPYIVSFL